MNTSQILSDNGDKQLIRKSQRLQQTTAASRRSAYVLPYQCIICTKEKWITHTATRKRKKEGLSKCEYEKGMSVSAVVLW